MDTCRLCSDSLSSGRTVTCSRTCGLTFHLNCAGLSKSHHSSWSANVGLFWFCDACRLNFDPAVYDREKTIIKTLRELLIRTDSIDTRLGNYGENLRRMNKTLYSGSQSSKQVNQSLDQTSFQRKIDMLTLDDVDDPINRTRSCEETSFFEVLDEINSTVAQPSEKFIVGPNKRVQILTNQPSSSSSSHVQENASTPAASSQKRRAPIITSDISSHIGHSSQHRLDLPASNRSRQHDNTRPSSGPLSVAKVGQTASDMSDFYVTPFTPNQSEEDIKQYIQEICKVDISSVRVAKLVPRGKKLDDLTFVSFKVSVDNTISEMIGDPWYWPEGVSVRAFDYIQKNEPTTLRPTSS